MKSKIWLIVMIIGIVGVIPLWAADSTEAAPGGKEAPAGGGKEGGKEAEVVTSVGPQGEIIFEGMVITGKKLSPEFYISAPINPTFPTVTFSRSFKDDILTPIDTSEFKEHVSRVRMAKVKHPFLWATTTTAVVTGVLAGYMAARGEDSWMYLGPVALISGGYSLIEFLSMKPEEHFE